MRRGLSFLPFFATIRAPPPSASGSQDAWSSASALGRAKFGIYPPFRLESDRLVGLERFEPSCVAPTELDTSRHFRASGCVAAVSYEDGLQKLSRAGGSSHILEIVGSAPRAVVPSTNRFFLWIPW